MPDFLNIKIKRMQTRVAKTIAEIRAEVSRRKLENKRIGFVPTMGALHKGHVSLIKKAVSLTDEVVVSIFVNPTQFAPGEDYTRYPRTFKADLEACEKAGASLVFCPDANEIYDEISHISFQVGELAAYLCGRSRPGHFNGVIQVVNKLFNIVKPDVAVFGQKDIQQFRIIEQMVLEFNHDIDIVMGETMRAADGLALSSRNRYLAKEDRVLAPMLYQTLLKLKAAISEGADIMEETNRAASELNQAGFKTDYLEIVDYQTLQPVRDNINNHSKYIIAIAAFLSNTRLIDNIVVHRA